jgi:hypothetical protein
MPELHLEIRQSDAWVPVGPVLRPGDLVGSVSDNTGGRREVYAFECLDECSIVRRSTGGVDASDSAARLIVTDGWEVVARLGPGESWGREILTDNGARCRIRLRHE